MSLGRNNIKSLTGLVSKFKAYCHDLTYCYEQKRGDENVFLVVVYLMAHHEPPLHVWALGEKSKAAAFLVHSNI